MSNDINLELVENNQFDLHLGDTEINTDVEQKINVDVNLIDNFIIDAEIQSPVEFEVELDGVPGMSAYEIAIKNGFVGTEEEWLDSLKGHADADMLKSVYDPNNISADAFDMTNMVESATKKIFTNAERAKLSGIQAGANLYVLPSDVPHDSNYIHTDNNYTTSEKTKLSGISPLANNYIHPNHTGDVSSIGDGTTTINNNVVTNAKLAPMATGRIKGKPTEGETGTPEDLTPAQVRSIINVEDGAQANNISDINASDLTDGGITELHTHDYNKLTNKPNLSLKADLVDGKVPTTQLPSFVDDVLEYSTFNDLPVVGEPGKIYVILDTNLTYRWSGTIYTEISKSLALGETSFTAFDGARGKIAYNHSQSAHAPIDAEKNVQSDWTESDINSDAFIKNKPAIPDQLSDLSDDSTHRLVTDTEKSNWNAKSNFSGSYNDLTNKPTIPDQLSDLSDDTTHRVVTDIQISTWDGKQDALGYTPVPNTRTVNNKALSSNITLNTNDISASTDKNYMTDAEKTKLAGIESGANNYVLPSDVVQDSLYIHTDNNYTTDEKSKLAGIEANANNYVLPATLPATMIIEDSTHRFTTDTEKSTWNNKADLVDGLVPASQLPSYVDDILEYADFSSLPTTGETGKIYVTINDNITYRWGGSSYVEISKSLALGETASTAFDGYRGKIAYDHSQSAHAPSNAEQNVQSDWNQSDNSQDDYIKNKPSIPTALSQLTSDSTHRLVTDTQISTWNNKQNTLIADTDYLTPSTASSTYEPKKGIDDNFMTSAEKTKLAGIADGAEVNVNADWNAVSGDAQILNKPTIPTKTSDLTNDSNFVIDASYVHTDNNYTNTEKTKLSGIAGGAEVNVQSDWTESNSNSDAYILNKPILAIVATSGSYNDLSNKPTIPTQYTDEMAQDAVGSLISAGSQSGITVIYNDTSNKIDFTVATQTDNNFTNDYKTKLDGIATGAEVNVQADWTETNISSDSYIQNKPTIPTTLASLTDDSTHRLVTDIEKSTWNGKQDALGYTAENLANKSTNIITDATSDIKYPSVKAIKDYADSLVTGLLDYRGAYNASGNIYPSSGGSGSAGAIMKGDMWIISNAGILGGNAVQVGDSIIANIDSPGVTASNWNILNGNISYVPEDVANKITSLSSGSTDTQYPSAKLVYNQLELKQPTLVNQSNIKSINGNSLLGSGDLTIIGVTDADKGDITVTNSGSTWTIDNGAVTLAKMADMATGSLIYRKTAGSGSPEVNTLTTLKTDLGLTGTNSGDETTATIKTKLGVSSSSIDGYLTSTDWNTFNNKQSTLVSGTNIKTINGNSILGSGNLDIIGVTDADKGDITVTNSGDVWTIDNSVVSNTKLANMNNATIKGRATTGAGNPEDLTASQVRTIINVADGATAGADWNVNISNKPIIPTMKVEVVTLTSTDISNKYVDLVNVPIDPSAVLVCPTDGIMQTYTSDYTIITNGSVIKRLNWNGLGLDGLLATNDKLIITYTYQA